MTLESLYTQCGQLLEDCDDYYDNIQSSITDEKHYISNLFEKIELLRKQKEEDKLRSVLLEVKAYVCSLKYSPRTWPFKH